MKSFKSYLKEYGVLNPAFAVGGSATGPGMGQYNPSADLNLRAQKKNQEYHARRVNLLVLTNIPIYTQTKIQKVQYMD